MAKNHNVLNGSNPFTASSWKKKPKKIKAEFLVELPHITAIWFLTSNTSRVSMSIIQGFHRKKALFCLLQFGEKRGEKKEKWRLVSTDGITARSRPFLPFSSTLLSHNKSHNWICFHCLQSTVSVPRAGHPWCCRNSRRETMKSVKVIPKNELNKVVSNEYQLCMAQWKPFKGTCAWTYFPSQQRFRFFTLHNDSWKKKNWPSKEILPSKSPKWPKKFSKDLKKE